MDNKRYPPIVGADAWPIVTKCAHKMGRWMFVHEGYLYGFSPPTQFMKDAWLGESGFGPEGEEARTQALRWFCFACHTLQMP